MATGYITCGDCGWTCDIDGPEDTQALRLFDEHAETHAEVADKSWPPSDLEGK